MRRTLTPNYFKEEDSLREDWYFTDYSLVEFGKALSRSPFQPGVVTPKEIVQCQTIGDVIALLHKKQ